MALNKTDLVNAVAESTKMTKVDAAKAVNSFIQTISQELGKKDGKVTLVGFGTFKVQQRQARKGRSPRTGAVITIPAKNVPKFKPGKALHEIVAGKKAAKKTSKKK